MTSRFTRLGDDKERDRPSAADEIQLNNVVVALIAMSECAPDKYQLSSVISCIVNVLVKHCTNPMETWANVAADITRILPQAMIAHAEDMASLVKSRH